MLPKWIHNRGSREKRAARPLFWWRQLETGQRTGLPFGHLFPRLPAARQPRPSESQRLVRELVEQAQHRPTLEDHVQQYLATNASPQTRHCDPVELWQIVGIARLDETEARKWGPGGRDIVEWFDKGELLSWPMDHGPVNTNLKRNAFRKIVDWLRGRPATQPRLADATI